MLIFWIDECAASVHVVRTAMEQSMQPPVILKPKFDAFAPNCQSGFEPDKIANAAANLRRYLEAHERYLRDDRTISRGDADDAEAYHRQVSEIHALYAALQNAIIIDASDRGLSTGELIDADCEQYDLYVRVK